MYKVDLDHSYADSKAHACMQFIQIYLGFERNSEYKLFVSLFQLIS